MKFINDVVELDVFNENGKLITSLKGLKKGNLLYRNPDSILHIEDAATDLELLGAIGRLQQTKEEISDFDRSLSNDEDVIVFGDQNNTSFKLIAKGIIYDGETSLITHDFKIVAPNAELVTGYELFASNERPNTPIYGFKLQPYNDEGDRYNIHLSKRN